MSFDRIAPYYRWLESGIFGAKLQRARIAWIDGIETPARVLIVGEGTGRFLCEFLERYVDVEVDCVDASARMLQLARGRARRDELRVRFLHEDLLTWSPKESVYDLIVTHFFLDCFDEVEIEKIVTKLARSGTQNAVWLLADFFVPRDPLRKLHAKAWLWAMHRFFRVAAGISARRLTNPSPLLETHGFRLAQRQEWRLDLLKSEMWRRKLL